MVTAATKAHSYGHPNPWIGFHTGAYKDWRLAECVKLVRGASSKQIEAIEHSFKGETPEHFRALNALQETRLCINEEMLGSSRVVLGDTPVIR